MTKKFVKGEPSVGAINPNPFLELMQSSNETYQIAQDLFEFASLVEDILPTKGNENEWEEKVVRKMDELYQKWAIYVEVL